MPQRVLSQRKRSGESSRRTRNEEIERPQDNEHLVGRVMRYMLAVNRKKIAIRAVQIKKMALPSNSQDFRAVMPRVKEKFEQIFGFRLIEMKGQKYFLVNKYQNPDLEPKTSEEGAEQVLLFLTLAFIFMRTDNAGAAVVREEELWDFFKSLDILRDGKGHSRHPYFGDLEPLIKFKFVDQLYLLRNKFKDSEIIGYEWGPRAEEEIDRRSILKFMSKVYNNRAIKSWPVQYAVMRNLEKPQFEQQDDD